MRSVMLNLGIMVTVNKDRGEGLHYLQLLQITTGMH